MRFLAWLGSKLPADPNLDRRDDWPDWAVPFTDKEWAEHQRIMAEAAERGELVSFWVGRRGESCVMCPRPALQDGLCGEHGGLPWFDWPGEKQARLVQDIEGQS